MNLIRILSLKSSQTDRDFPDFASHFHKNGDLVPRNRIRPLPSLSVLPFRLQVSSVDDLKSSNRPSSGIALDYGLDDRIFGSRQGLGILLFTTASRPALGPTRTPIQRVPGALSLEMKWQGREADHSPPSSVEVENAWSYTSTPQYAFMAWCSVKAQGQLYLYQID
jgi:hypothetical protein